MAMAYRDQYRDRIIRIKAILADMIERWRVMDDDGHVPDEPIKMRIPYNGCDACGDDDGQ